MRFSGVGRWAIVFAALLACGCAKQEKEKPLLYLYCGAGIRPPVSEMVAEFERKQGVKMECDYAGSEVLLSRIKLSRRGDLYMPGDARYVEQARREGLILSSVDACYWIPVIVVQKGNPKGIESVADLTKPGLRVGLGDPTACAIGKISARVLKKNNIAEEDIEPNIVFRSLTVNELGVHIKTGKIDAAIVWDGIANLYADVGDVVRIPPEQNVVSTVPLAVLKFSQHPELAKKFQQFVTSQRGKEIFAKYGYTTERPE